MTSISSEWVSGFDVPMLVEFIDEVNIVLQRGQRKEKKYLQRVFVSKCFGPTKNPTYSVLMIKGTNARESDV